MIASFLKLTRADIQALRIRDSYSLHRVVYDLYPDVRTEPEKRTSIPSGILYADKGGDWNQRHVLMLANRSPRNPVYGKLESKTIPPTFLQYNHYGFEVIINPTKRDKNSGKIIAIRSPEAITQWFNIKASDSWGFQVKPENMQLQHIGVKSFNTKGHTITLGSATIRGELMVTDRSKFIRSFQLGIGRGRAFGFGLLQLVPLLNPTTTFIKE